MTERLALDADYCPHCGVAVEAAEAVSLTDDLATQGVFERGGAHLAIEGSEIRVYEHAGGEQ